MWINVTDTQGLTHQLNLDHASDFVYDTKNNSWIVIMTNHNGLLLSQESYDKIINLIENRCGNIIQIDNDSDPGQTEEQTDSTAKIPQKRKVKHDKC